MRLLETEGLAEVWVTELEDGEVGEDEAVSLAAQEIGCGCLEIRLAAGGRANLFATEDCCVLVDDDLLRQINCISSVVIATTPNFTDRGAPLVRLQDGASNIILFTHAYALCGPDNQGSAWGYSAGIGGTLSPENTFQPWSRASSSSAGRPSRP